MPCQNLKMIEIGLERYYTEPGPVPRELLGEFFEILHYFRSLRLMPSPFLKPLRRAHETSLEQVRFRLSFAPMTDTPLHGERR
jgi:hypothetical protein